MDNMRIAQVCSMYHPYIGGIETHVRMICERLVKQGFSVEVLCTDPLGNLPDEEIINEVKVRRFRSWAPGEAYYFSLDLGRYLKKNSKQYDLVHAHAYHALPAYLAARTKNWDHFVFTPHYHGRGHTPFRSLLLRPYKFLGKEIFEKADRIICVSRYEKNLLLKDFSIGESKIDIIPNGVDLSEFNGLKRSRKISKTILSVGRLEQYKGMQHLIKALKYLDSDILLNIVGKGPYKSNLEKMIKSINLEDRVTIKGGLDRPNLLQMYVDADLFALLSTNEAYGISVAEALAAGTPCVVANESGLSEWIDGENCIGVNFPLNYTKIAETMRGLMGKRVKDSRILDWDQVTKMVIDSYYKILR